MAVVRERSMMTSSSLLNKKLKLSLLVSLPMPMLNDLVPILLSLLFPPIHPLNLPFLSDAASSISSGARNFGPTQPGSEQFVMKVPNDKVALVIGKGGETIKSMQSRTGARIQVVPLHLPPGDTSTERDLYINGTSEQIEAAKELVNEVLSGNRLKVLGGANAYAQPTYPQGTGWPPQGQTPTQQPPNYGYTQAGSYPMQPPPYYGGYPPQSTGWEQQTAAPPAVPSQQQSTGYNAYGQVPPSSTPPSVNYNYSQIPPATGYNYNQGYPQQPPYGQDTSAQAQTQTQAPATYGPPATTSQPDGSAAAAQTSQPGYGTSVSAGRPDPSTYPTSYAQTGPVPTPANSYGAYPSYSGAPSVQPTYTQAVYQQMGYGQQQGQVANQASYAYYGQSGYPPSQAPVQAGYYQSSYSHVPPGQGPPQSGNGDTNLPVMEQKVVRWLLDQWLLLLLHVLLTEQRTLKAEIVADHDGNHIFTARISHPIAVVFLLLLLNIVGSYEGYLRLIIGDIGLSFDLIRVNAYIGHAI